MRLTRKFIREADARPCSRTFEHNPNWTKFRFEHPDVSYHGFDPDRAHIWFATTLPHHKGKWVKQISALFDPTTYEYIGLERDAGIRRFSSMEDGEINEAMKRFMEYFADMKVNGYLE